MKQAIMEMLSALSNNQLQEVITFSQNLIQLNGQQKGEDSDSFYDILKEILKYKYRIDLPHFAQFKRQKTFNSYRERVAVLDQFYESCIGDTHRNKAYKLKFYRLCIGFALDGISEWGTIGIPTILHAISDMPALIEKNFPGYLASGMLGIILDAHTKN